MKRDWELVRVILCRLEDMDTTNGSLDANDVEDYSPEFVSYHMNLLDEAGLIEANCAKPLSGPMQCFAFSLTWEGHEFLDKIRTETVWNKTKDLIQSKGIDLSFDAIKYAASTVLKGMLG